MTEPMPETPCTKPHVDTASFVREGDDLIVTLDGEEFVLPGGSVNVCVEDDGKVRVYLHAEFYASAADVLSENTGS